MSKIIVIGGGIAGLKAALDLASKNHNVTVLEARSRLGGRIYTVKASDNLTPIELGASYWEGLNENPFYQHYFAKKDSSFDKPFIKIFDESNSMFIDLDQPEKKALQPKQIASYYFLAKNYFQKILKEKLGKNYQELIDSCDFSFLEVTDAYWVKKIMELQVIHQSTPLSEIGFPDFKIFPDLSKLNAFNEDEANFCFVGGGYGNVIKQIAKECVDAGVNIITNSPVTQIIDNGSQGVKIHTSQQFLDADKVICAIPIGVLKVQAQSLFSKPLSSEKLEAIASMGVHDSTRIVLEFEAPFWDNPYCPYILLCSSHQKGMKEFRNNFALHGRAILQTPSYAHEAKNLSDEAIINLILSDLRKAFPQKQIPFPKYYIVHRWSEDPYARGAYPYRTLAMNEKKHQALERPEGNIYFAGSDFSRYGFSVHHGYASGRYIATQLELAL